MAIYAFKGKAPRLGRDVLVVDSASVIGEVDLGDEASVWFGAVIRGDYEPIRIGARTNVQDNAVVHITAGTARTAIGADVTVGHSAIVHGATVEDLCLIGMGSILLDGALVGRGSVVAAGSLLTPGTVVPPASLVMGRPAKVVRALGQDALASIGLSAASYVGYAAEIRASCVKL